MRVEKLKQIANQVLTGLVELHDMSIIHCDLKPENILFSDGTETNIKLIDFGTASSNNQNFSYVQSRFYRSPEVLFGQKITEKIDMWSFACIIVELLLGHPLFPCIDENELLECQIVTVGQPPDDMVSKSPLRRNFYDENMRLIRSSESFIPEYALPGSDSIRRVLHGQDKLFINFVDSILKMDPNQ